MAQSFHALLEASQKAKPNLIPGTAATRPHELDRLDEVRLVQDEVAVVGLLDFYGDELHGNPFNSVRWSVGDSTARSSPHCDERAGDGCQRVTEQHEALSLSGLIRPATGPQFQKTGDRIRRPLDHTLEWSSLFKPSFVDDGSFHISGSLRPASGS